MRKFKPGFTPFVGWLCVFLKGVDCGGSEGGRECWAGFTDCVVDRSSKSALHGLIHWLSQNYGPKGIMVNGVAPALIKGTKMLPGNPEELAKSKW